MSAVQFSKRLRKQVHLGHSHPRLRVLALLLTLGEVAVAYIMFRRTDFLGAYAMGAYLAKEHVIARFMGGE
jgi:hypothetical protein